MCEINRIEIFPTGEYGGSGGIRYGNRRQRHGGAVLWASIPAKESSYAEGREDTSNGASSGSSLMDRVVLSASHPNLIERARHVGSSELEAAGNPIGQGILRRMKEKVLKDVTNKLEVGPVNFKPNWSTPRVSQELQLEKA